jgi:hypothetical protein
MPIKPTQFYPINILGLDTSSDWVVFRYPFTNTGAETIDVMQPGYLVKFNAARNAVLPALAVDDAVLGGIIVDKPDPGDDPANPTVAVAVQGRFNRNQVHYADAHAVVPPAGPAPLSVAAVERLGVLGIFLDPAVPAGPFAP